MSIPAAPKRLARTVYCQLDLSGSGSRRLVQRRHCLYSVSQCPKRAVVWCRPISELAHAWMQAQGFDLRRVSCAWHEVDPLIARHEAAIDAGVYSNIVAGRGGAERPNLLSPPRRPFVPVPPPPRSGK